MPLQLSGSVGLGGDNRPDDVVAVKARLIELGMRWIAQGPHIGPVTINAIRLFQGMKNGVNKLAAPGNDGRIDPGGDTLKWLNAANAPEWRLMTPDGPGFTNDERKATADNHDYGSSWLDDTITAAGAAYAEGYLVKHPAAALLTINDASIPRGGDTPSHAGHETGLVCDIRLPRTDGTAGGITTRSALFDRDAMRAQIKAFLKQPLALRVFLIDAVLNREGICLPVRGHSNHAHFEIKPPRRKPVPIDDAGLRPASPS